MIQLKQRLFFQCKGLKQATFPQLMNADKERGDNQTKGIFLLLVSLWFVKCFCSSPWLVKSFNQRMPTNKWPSSAISLHPPPVPSLLTTRLQPLTLPSPPFSSSCFTACCDPSCTSWSPQQTLGVWRRSGVQAWLSLHSSLCTEEAALRVYNYLPLAFSAGSSTVQALAPAWGDALGYTLGD